MTGPGECGGMSHVTSSGGAGVRLPVAGVVPGTVELRARKRAWRRPRAGTPPRVRTTSGALSVPRESRTSAATRTVYSVSGCSEPASACVVDVPTSISRGPSSCDRGAAWP